MSFILRTKNIIFLGVFCFFTIQNYLSCYSNKKHINYEIQNEIIQPKNKKKNSQITEIIITSKKNLLREYLNEPIAMNDYDKVLAELKEGLTDKDWELNYIALTIAVKYDLQALFPFVKRLKVPPQAFTGLTEEETNTLKTLKTIALKQLSPKKYKVPPPFMQVPPNMESIAKNLKSFIHEQEKGKNDSALLLSALMVNPPLKTIPKNLPQGVVFMNEQFFIKNTQIELVFIPAIVHLSNKNNQWIKPEKGFFITKFPLKKSNFEKSFITKHDLQFSDAEFLVAPLDKINIITHYVQENSKAKVNIPNLESWEMAANGPYNSPYPWGLSQMDYSREYKSFWGLKNIFQSQPGEWLNSQNESGKYYIGGGVEARRTKDFKFAQNDKNYALRLVVGLE